MGVGVHCVARERMHAHVYVRVCVGAGVLTSVNFHYAIATHMHATKVNAADATKVNAVNAISRGILSLDVRQAAARTLRSFARRIFSTQQF